MKFTATTKATDKEIDAVIFILGKALLTRKSVTLSYIIPYSPTIADIEEADRRWSRLVLSLIKASGLPARDFKLAPRHVQEGGRNEIRAEVDFGEILGSA